MKEYILMGDIIGSSSKKSPKLLKNFVEMINSVNVKYKNRLKSLLKISLGDEFQCITKDLITAVSIIFEINEMIIKSGETYSLRFALNFGEVETKITNTKPMLGKGLTDARKRIEYLKKSTQKFYVNLDEDDFAKADLLNDAFLLYQFFIDDWKAKDYPTVKEFLFGKNYKEVAKIFSIDDSTAWRREKSLHITQYHVSKNLILNIAK